MRRFRAFFPILFTLSLAIGLFIICGNIYVRAATKPEKPVIVLTEGNDGTSIKVTIHMTSGADGYQIYMKSKTDSKYKKIKTLKKNGTDIRYYTVKNLMEGQYKFKVRAYLNDNGTIVKGSYSKVASITVDGITSVTDTGEQKLLTIKDSNNKLTKTVRERICDIFEKVYLDIWDYFRLTDPEPVIIEIIKTDGSPAYTVGNVISVDYDYANNNYGDLDFITHELVHVAQGYKDSEVPVWLVEGIADYGRYKFGVYNHESGWGFHDPSENEYYSDSYGITAAFLDWIAQNYDNNFVKKLNKAVQNGTFSMKYFEISTGKTVDELWELYLKAHGITIKNADLTIPQISPISPETDLLSYLTIIDKSKKLSAASKANIKKVFAKAYGKICEKFNYGTLYPVTIIIDPNEDDVAYTDCDQHTIVIGADYYLDNLEDYDLVTHELVHVAQCYQASVPWWLTEGMADYGRYLFGLNNKSAGWRLPWYTSGTNNYSAGYKDCAAFLCYISDRFGEDVIDKLNYACKNDLYTPHIWKQLTGKTLPDLDAEYHNDTALKIPKSLGESVEDLKFLDGKGNLTTLLSLKGKPTLLLLANFDENNYDYSFEQLLKIGKPFKNKINIAVISIYNSKKEMKEILNKVDADTDKIAIFYDSEMFWAFGVYESPGVLISPWPNIVILDSDLHIVLGGYMGAKYYPKADPTLLFWNDEVLEGTLSKLLSGN